MATVKIGAPKKGDEQKTGKKVKRTRGGRLRKTDEIEKPTLATASDLAAPGGVANSKVWSSPDYVVEKKLDGWRYLLHFGARHNRVYFTNRKGEEHGLNLQALWPDAGVRRAYGYTVLDGMLLPPEGKDLSVLPNIVAGKPGEGLPRFVVFDCLWLDGEDMRDKEWKERHEALKDFIDDLLVEGDDAEASLEDESPTRLVKLAPAFKQDRLKRAKKWVADGAAGCILKQTAAKYGEGWFSVRRRAFEEKK